MKQLLFIDFETHYEPKTYSLTKMGTESYISDRRFEAYGCAVAHGYEKPRFLAKPELSHFFAGIDWANTMLVCHTRFDAAILAWRFHHRAGGYIDTAGIANVYIVPYTGYARMNACFQHMGMPQKSGVLDEVIGLRYDQIVAIPGLWGRVAEYACHDLVGCQEIVKRYYGQMPTIERAILSWTIENYCRGRARLDCEVLVAALEKIQIERAGYMQALSITEKQLRSRNGFVEVLAQYGVETEFKNGKGDTWLPALAKDDAFMKRMLEHEQSHVRLLAQARLLFASSLEITRLTRLIEMHDATKGKMLFPLNYAAARTGRFGGSDDVNPQNFGRKSPIKRAIIAPKGKVFIQVDQSQIEARLVAYMSGCMSLIEAFREKRDVYAEFATVAFGRPIDKDKDPSERQTGKVSILQLGYQSGGHKLWVKLNDAGLMVDAATAEYYKETYRRQYKEIPDCWYHLQRMLAKAIAYRKEVDWIMGIKFTPKGILLPSGRWLLYDKLHIDTNGVPAFYDPRYKTMKSLYGGAIMENICQAIARDVTNRTLVRFRATVVLQVHDNIYRLIDEATVGREYGATMRSMREVPPWLHIPQYGPCPIDCEGWVSNSFQPPT